MSIFSRLLSRRNLGVSLGPAPTTLWLVTVPWVGTAEVRANTASEARAAAKRQLGIKARLPVGTVVQRLG